MHVQIYNILKWSDFDRYLSAEVFYAFNEKMSVAFSQSPKNEEPLLHMQGAKILVQSK